MVSDFVHLHVHTDFSQLDGACRADRLAERVKELGMNAVAISDHGTISGVPSFFKAVKSAGIKPLVGCELYLAGASRLDKVSETNPTYHMGVIARNSAGYRNLVKLSTDAQRSGFHYKPRTDMETLAENCEGLVAFTGCMQGMVPQLLLRGDERGARAAMRRFIDIFGKDQVFVELMNHGIREQEVLLKPLIAMAKEFGLQTIATNDVHYIREEHAHAHDSCLCIQTAAKKADPNRMRYDPRAFWLKSQAQMESVFAETPEALTGTRMVSEMVDFNMDFSGKHYPTIAPPPGFADSVEYLEYACAKGLMDRYGIDYYREMSLLRPVNAPEIVGTRDAHTESRAIAGRLAHELAVIKNTGFNDYFAVVSDFVDWAKQKDIPVGPGRGSGAGCMVAYTLGITDIDPHKYGLLFERFLNPERVSPPDLDIDFCKRRRGEVIEYVRQKYGSACVSGIVTFNTLGAKGVIRDLARVHGIPLSEADKIAKTIPDIVGIELHDAMEASPEMKALVESKPAYMALIDEGQVLEGMVRAGGQHASGVLISSTPLEDVVPMVRQKEGAEMLAGYDGETVAELGLLKMDFLGLKTLTVVYDAVKHIQRDKDLAFEINGISLADAKTFELMREGRTTGVFQFESGGMKALCRQINISKFEEIAAANALFRPGPMDLIPEYISGKRDPSTVKYMHPLLEPICRETYGIMVYQEQVMEAARVIAGYTLGGADVLRKAMGKKKLEEMVKQRSVFIAGAKKTNGIAEGKANEIFDVLERFAGYGFNKSHSVGYAKMAYQTAYLKAHYPSEYMSALLTSEIGKTEECAKFCAECRAMKLDVLAPDINKSSVAFMPEGNGVRYSLGGIKTVGEGAAQAIVSERELNGAYSSVEDLLVRVDKKHINRRVLDALVKTGSLASLEPDTGKLLGSLDLLTARADEARCAIEDEGITDQVAMDFGDTEPTGKKARRKSEPEVKAIEFTRDDALAAEREYLGLYVSGHPLEDIRNVASAICTHTPDQLTSADDRTEFRICGVIMEMEVKTSKKDKRKWAKFCIDTPDGQYPIQCYADCYGRNHETLVPGKPLVVTGTVLKGDEEARMSMSDAYHLDQVLPQTIASLTLPLSGPQVANFTGRASKVAQKRPGDTKIALIVDGRIAQSESICLTLPALKAMLQHPAVTRDEVTATAVAYAKKRRMRYSGDEALSPMSSFDSLTMAHGNIAGFGMEAPQLDG